MKTLTVKAQENNLYQVLDFVDGELESAGCSAKSRLQIDVAVEELFINIARYAYAPETGDAAVAIDIQGEPPAAEITLSDSGMPFDPFSKEDPDISLSAEKRPVGGLGVLMVKKTMDEVHYEYSDGLNITTIRKLI